MSYKNHIYFASTLALLSLSTALFINNDNAQADADYNTVTTQQITNQQNNSANTINITNTNNVLVNNPSTTSATATTQSASAVSRAYDGTPIISIGDSNYPRVDAVDVSGFQAGLTYNNFVSLKNAGVKTAIVKLTEGTYYTNPYDGQQITNARNAGLNVQVYHYAKFNSWNAAVAEANYLANEMNRLGLSGNTMIYADMEDNSTKYAGVANNLTGFWQQLNNRGFTNHGVYASTSYDAAYNVSSTVGRNRTWIAQYLYNPTYLANQNYGAWQFNSHGRIAGYNGDLDISVDYQGLFGSVGTWKYNNGWQYEVDGQNVTGWQHINDNWYFFDNNGTAKTGWYQSNYGNWYYFDPSNAWADKGFQYINGNWYDFDNSNAWMNTGWQKIDGNWYYFDPSNGHMLSGMQTINGQLYDLNDQHDGTFGAMKTGWQKIDNNWYYFGNYGAQTGWFWSGYAWYYFNQNGTAKTGWQKINGHNYYFDLTNAWALTGFQYINDNWYDFDNSNAWMNTGWQKIDGNWYYFDPSNGHMLSGMQTINGQLYDLNDQHDGTFGAMKTGWQKIDNNWYYFGNYGAQTGWFWSGYAWYYFNQNGKAKLGLNEINQHLYYFDPINAYMITGSLTINGKQYYFRENHDGYFGAAIIK